MLGLHASAVVALLVLLAVANIAPILAKKAFGSKFSWPIDGGLKLGDGQPLFGKSKTIRGVVSALLAAGLAAPILGMDWRFGGMIAALSMAGDLLSSFIKRRMGQEPSSMALGLDQIPESLLPAIAAAHDLGLSTVDVSAVTAAFFVGELFGARLFYALKIKDRPY